MKTIGRRIENHLNHNGVSVPLGPYLYPRHLMGWRSLADQELFPFPDDRTVLTYSGGAALSQAGKLLALGKNDQILCPAYHCGHEIEPFLRSGIGVKLYHIKNDLQIDIDDLRKQIDRHTRAVLITHYFGFPQDSGTVRTICRENGLYLIEDCAHALFSKSGDQALGSVGDVSVFSIRKTLPTPNGGAMVINNPSLTPPPRLEGAPILSTWNKTLNLLLNSLRGDALGAKPGAMSKIGLFAMLPVVGFRKIIYDWTKGNTLLWHDPDDEAHDVNVRVYSWGMGWPGVRVFRNTDWKSIVKKRRENFEYLLRSLTGINSLRVVFPSLPDGVCPLFFPVICSHPQKIARDLSAKGIGTVVWWGSFHAEVGYARYRRESFLKQHVLALPIHQDIGVEHLNRTVIALRQSL